MLTTLPLSSTPAGVLLTLPQVSTRLPREKPLPAQKEKTKWQQFAERKGIKPKTREQRREKARNFNEDKGEWEKTWGYKGKRKEGTVPDDWVVEVTEKSEREAEEKKNQKKKRKV